MINIVKEEKERERQREREREGLKCFITDNKQT